ncbi:DUF6249 domain-containing protein [Thalassotalea agarivorans]|uniref:DUF6249 domain-containing protein n=1 Tax=Thalassotalea agarivorans TaxID=349064 RepID=A0A1I0H1H9_THASX|nr:DUF6249 domain-containing protein [Thalassotalea agarivorans]SET77545.1 hypothetical protein SAMN05660429_02648 [Thalassotalea agarivorans]
MGPDIIIPSGFFIAVCFTVYLILKHSSQSKQMQHETIHKLIESGQQLSPELLDSLATVKKDTGTKDLTRGIIFVSIAIAFFLFGWITPGGDLDIVSIGVFPLCLGIAFLLIHKFKPTQS